MMLSPTAYIKEFENADYPSLIAERDQLIVYLQNFEKNEISGDRFGQEWEIMPRPNVKYQVYLEYLAELCKLMQDKYNADYVHGDRKLSEDFQKYEAIHR